MGEKTLQANIYTDQTYSQTDRTYFTFVKLIWFLANHSSQLSFTSSHTPSQYKYMEPPSYFTFTVLTLITSCYFLQILLGNYAMTKKNNLIIPIHYITYLQLIQKGTLQWNWTLLGKFKLTSAGIRSQQSPARHWPLGPWACLHLHMPCSKTIQVYTGIQL